MFKEFFQRLKAIADEPDVPRPEPTPEPAEVVIEPDATIEDPKDREIALLKSMVAELREQNARAWKQARDNFRAGDEAYYQNQERRDKINAAFHDLKVWLNTEN